MGQAKITNLDMLRDIPLRWLVFWLLLPNIIVIALWPVIGVPMQAGLTISGISALILSQAPWRAVRILGIVAITLAVTTLYICQLFAIPPLNIGLITQFLSDVRPFRSPEYGLAGAAVLAVVLVGAWFAPRVRPFSSRAQFLYAAIAVLMLINLDGALAFDARVSHRALPTDTKVDSAVKQVRLTPTAAQGRNVLLIVVEALGAPVSPAEQALFRADWDRPEWRSRYKVSHGTTQFFGSTTNGELRELCDRWVHYSEFDFAAAECLPQHFRSSGYETTAIHSFGGGLFARHAWYPKIGFDKLIFADELFDGGARLCPGVFPGACDADVPRQITRQLARADRPQFLYWLTLNTHLPVVEDEALGTSTCTMGTPEWRSDFPALCRLFQLHHALADAISQMAMDPDLPPTDIVIVGDHKPPMFDRTSAGRFDSGRVPWIYLRARPPASSPQA